MASKQETDKPQRDELARIREGLVVSDRRDKTRTVVCQYRWQHPKYGKILMRDTRYQVHDENNESQMGDRVRIAPCRPVSKTKSWRLVEVVESDVSVPDVTTDLQEQQQAGASEG
ncbi:MAG: 30S ribosomal protein S17 [Phycisphaeraceae bacterium]|nr:30S ribosomal protein S17 [Phycisphaeraceae bacterium]